MAPFLILRCKDNQSFFSDFPSGRQLRPLDKDQGNHSELHYAEAEISLITLIIPY